MAAVPPQIPGLVGWRPLARGGFATVWEAKQVSLNRLVAVKVDRRTLDSDAEQRRFLRESGAAGRMSGHPGIVTVYDAGILTDDRPYLVMALCEGGSLTKWVKGNPKPTQEQVREVGVRIADALAATHAAGVLHRDVKPANILIDSYGNAGLADFGLAALPDPGMELSETLEAITPAYAPPEVFHRQPPTEAGDVYSLGATLYAMLAGRPPRWPESGTPNIVDMFERLQDPIERIPGVDRGFMDLLLASMVHEKAERPTAAEFRDGLTALKLPREPERTATSAEALAGAAGVGGGAGAGAGGGSVALEVGTKVRGRRLGGGRKSAGATAAPANGTNGSTARNGSAGPVEESDPLLPFPLAEQLTTDPPHDRPTTDPPRTEEERPRRRPVVILVAVIAALVALSLIAVLTGLLPRPVAVGPAGSPADPTVVGAPSASSSAGGAGSPALTPSATPSGASTGQAAVPAGFEDCSDQLGAEGYCAAPEPECWDRVEHFGDTLILLTQIDCDETHVFQTYAAGPLAEEIVRQSEVESLPAAKKLCTRAVLDERFVNASDRDAANWDIWVLGRQSAGEQFFRCVFGKAPRSGPIALTAP